MDGGAKAKKIRKRKSGRKATKEAAAKSARKRALKRYHLVRVRPKPTAFTPCQKENRYNKSWPITPAYVATSSIKFALATGHSTIQQVENLGELGAKWYIANQVVRKIIPDNDDAAYKADTFCTFSGAHTFDIVYVDSVTGHVYVIEAKGTQQGSAAHLSTRQNGKTQGNWDYLAEVADEMEQSTDAMKAAVAAKIKSAYQAQNGKLHYIGVHTTYPGGTSATPNKPTELFSKTR